MYPPTAARQDDCPQDNPMPDSPSDLDARQPLDANASAAAARSWEAETRADLLSGRRVGDRSRCVSHNGRYFTEATRAKSGRWSAPRRLVVGPVADAVRARALSVRRDGRVRLGARSTLGEGRPASRGCQRRSPATRADPGDDGPGEPEPELGPLHQIAARAALRAAPKPRQVGHAVVALLASLEVV
jgi:hypothetical protein